jgi:hypothetical protein
MISSLGIVSVATNIYLEYWKIQAESVDRNVPNDLRVTIHIFTDQPEEASGFGRTLKNLTVKAHRIPAYRWPEATLYRYRIFNQHRDLLSEDVLMYLDADMLVHESLQSSYFLNSANEGASLVRHPGYYRPKGLELLSLYLRKPDLLVSDASSRLRLGGLGAWETNPASAAFVERRRRRTYYCGGTWWASRKVFGSLVHELDLRVTRDEAQGVMAVWHDESHINWWGANHSHETKSPAFCYSTGYPWLKGLRMVIQAVDKTDSTRS